MLERRGGFVVLAALTVTAVMLMVTPASGADVPAGFVAGKAHALRVRPILGEVLSAPKRRVRPGAAGLAAVAVASCDPARVAAIAAVPSTARAGDSASECVVNSSDRNARRARRYLLGPARLTGSDVVSARVRETRVSKKAKPTYTVEMKLTDRGSAAFAADPSTANLAVVVDGEVVPGTLTPTHAAVDGATALTLAFAAERRGLSRAAATGLVRLIGQARSEEVIGFAGLLTMTPDARALFASNSPRIDDKRRFARDCPIPESPGTFVLGCQGNGRIFLLRVDRPDLAQIMAVTAAHEMLHAAYSRLDRAERRRIDRLTEEALTASTDQRMRDLVTEYDTFEPGERSNELHSLLGTEVATLSRPLERYYRRYFRDRTRVVDAFTGYQSVFDTLKAEYDQLKSEVDGLEAQLNGLSAQRDAAGGEADQLTAEIESLRGQGRIEESNRLVGAQNSAVNRARAFADQFNGLVGQYNAKVDALNALAIAGRQLDDAIGTTLTHAPGA
jgi:hypothetical protein